MELKIRGMKNETLELDKEQTNVEKKNLCAKLVSDANMDYTQSLLHHYHHQIQLDQFLF